MAISVPIEGRVMACIRLSEVPITIRRRFGRALLDDAIASGDLLAAVQLKAAIEEPSSQIYWLPAEAIAKVLKR